MNAKTTSTSGLPPRTMINKSPQGGQKAKVKPQMITSPLWPGPMDRLHSLPRLVQPYCMQPALLLSAYARHPPS